MRGPGVDFFCEPLWCLDRLTLHSFVPELCVNLSFREKGHQQASAAGLETVCANLTPSANIETAAPSPAHETRWSGPGKRLSKGEATMSA